MREKTRAALFELCREFDPAKPETVRALWERAPYGDYYVRDEAGKPAFILNVSDEELACERVRS